jgi:hypothetical protein
MPFAGPETALASTIRSRGGLRIILAKLNVLRAATSPLRLFNDLHEGSTTYGKRLPASRSLGRCAMLSAYGVRFPVRVLRGMEYNFSRCVRRPPAELRRRLPGLLQAQHVARGVRHVVAGILHHCGIGITDFVEGRNTERNSPRFSERVIVSRSTQYSIGIPERIHCNGYRLRLWQDGRAQHGDHTI